MISRKFLVISLLFVCSSFIVNLHAEERKVEYPYVTYTSISYCVVHEIEIDANFTKVSLYYRNPYPNGWVNFSRVTTLKDLGKNRVYNVIYTEGVPLSPQKKNLGMGECVYFSLFFPPIPEDSKYIEINENIENGFHFVIKLESDVNRYLQQYAAMETFIKRKEGEYARKEEEEYARRRAARMMWEQEQERKRNQNRVKNPKERRKTLIKNPDFKID